MRCSRVNRRTNGRDRQTPIKIHAIAAEVHFMGFSQTTTVCQTTDLRCPPIWRVPLLAAARSALPGDRSSGRCSIVIGFDGLSYIVARSDGGARRRDRLVDAPARLVRALSSRRLRGRRSAAAPNAPSRNAATCGTRRTPSAEGHARRVPRRRARLSAFAAASWSRCTTASSGQVALTFDSAN